VVNLEEPRSFTATIGLPASKAMRYPAYQLLRIYLPRTLVNRHSCELALTDLASYPPSIACWIIHPAATVRIAFPLLGLIDGETTGFQSPLV
jgi:hypothetical protein